MLSLINKWHWLSRSTDPNIHELLIWISGFQVCSAALERCRDPVPLDTVALDRLVQAKKAKTESAEEEAPAQIGA